MNGPATLQQGNYVQAVADEHCFHLGLGQPSPRLLPIELVSQSSSRLFAAPDPLLLQYNRGAGAESLRSSVANFLTRHRGHLVEPSSLVISAGNSQALGWVASTLSSAGDRVLCENPTYFLASKILSDEGLLTQGIDVDAQGLCVDTLEKALQDGLRAKWLYCIPTHHNPTGANLTSARLQKLLALAERYDFLVVFDDPYAQLHFGEHPESALDRNGPLPEGPWLRLGSFSKIFAPGMRLGWIEASQSVQKTLLAKGVRVSGGGVNPISGALVQQALDSGDLERHRDLVRAALKERALALSAAVTQQIPGARLLPVTGGYFAWLQWDAPFEAREFARFARSQGVFLLAGELCCVNAHAPWIHAGRISLSFYEPDELKRAIDRLSQSLQAFENQSIATARYTDQ